MSAPRRTVWQDAWDRAQPRLSAIRTSLSSATSATPRALRVGQLDSELLDQELIHLLEEPLNKALALVNSTLKSRFQPELSLAIQLTLYKLSIWTTGASYGAQLQDLKYTTGAARGAITPSGLPRRILLVHGALTVVMPYAYSRIRTHALSNSWPDAPSSDRRRKLWDMVTNLESIHNSLALLNFISFLVDGRYRTLADRLLKLRLVPTRRLIRRDVSYEFMNRQMVWHSFTEFLLFLLPIINARAIRRRLARLASYLDISAALPARAKSILGTDILAQAGLTRGKRGRYWYLPPEQCAICAENASYEADASQSMGIPAYSAAAGASVPTSAVDLAEVHDELDPEPPNFAIYTPYITGCGHVYCYHCITERMMRASDEDPDGLGWECLRCNESVRSADRVEGEVTQEDLSDSLTGEDGDNFELGELDTSEFLDSSLDDDNDEMSMGSGSD